MLLTDAPTLVGRFEVHRLPDGSTVYFDPIPHCYYGEVKPNAKSEGGYSYVQASALTGVSTAAKFLDGDPTGLMHWAAWRDQDGIARIASDDLDRGGNLYWLRSQGSIMARLKDEKATWEHERDRRAEQGTNVHKETVWKLATGQDATLADVSDAERGFSQGVFASFRALGLRDNVKYAEQLTVAHDKRVAGRFDVWAEIDIDRFETLPKGVENFDTLRTLLDYKTRDAAGKIRKSDHVQLQGYEDCNVTCEIGESDAQAVIIVLPDGGWELYWCNATPAEWFASLNACHAGKQVERRMAKAKREADKAREEIAA